MTDDAHLDDEQLSAALDGADPGPHLEGCGQCRARLEDLRRVAALVAGPVPPPPPGAVDAAVAAALRSREVVPLGRRLASPRVLALAAALLALLLAVPVLSSLDSDDGDTQTAAGDADENATLEAAAPYAAVEDLGPLDAARIEDLVTSRLRAAGAPAADAAEGGSGAGAGGGAAEVATAPTAEEPKRECLPTLGRADSPELRASGTWEGTAAEVVAFREADEVVAYVIARSDCRILHFARFRA